MPRRAASVLREVVIAYIVRSYLLEYTSNRASRQEPISYPPILVNYEQHGKSDAVFEHMETDTSPQAASFVTKVT